MTRLARHLIVAAVSLATAATGICSSLSAGTESSCPVVQSDERDSGCDREPGDGACPEAPARPTCRTCDNTVAFLLEDKTAVGAAPSANPAHVSTVAPRATAPTGRAIASLHLSSISSAPPLHLRNVTFRN